MRRRLNSARARTSRRRARCRRASTACDRREEDGSPGCCCPCEPAFQPGCSRVSRGRRRPTRANTHCVKPLQSKPLGSEPPFRYGVPRSSNASCGRICLTTSVPAVVVSGRKRERCHRRKRRRQGALRSRRRRHRKRQEPRHSTHTPSTRARGRTPHKLFPCEANQLRIRADCSGLRRFHAERGR